MIDITIDQPHPGQEFTVLSEAPMGLEICAPGGQLFALLVFQGVPVEDIVMTVLPAFRQQSGVLGPIFFRPRGLTEAELLSLNNQ